MITRIHILLEPQSDSGAVALFEGKRYCCGGGATTNLGAGKYQLVAESASKRWKILGVGEGPQGRTRFVLDLDVVDPFALGYANPVQLEVSTVLTADSYVPDPFIEPLKEVGAGAFLTNDDYVDNGIESGEFEIYGGAFTLVYSSGERFELTNHVLWNDLVAQVQGSSSIYTFYKLKPPMKQRILPRVFDARSAPNIAAMVKDILEALPGARAMQQIGRLLLDQVQIGPRPLGRGPKGISAAPRSMRMRQLPKERIQPVNGVVNVGGGPKDGVGVTNLNPIVPGTGGPKTGIPNHVAAGFEDVGNIFSYGSVRAIKSSRLPFQTVNWPQSAKGAYSVMAPGGRLHMNVWTRSQAEVDQVVRAFTDAGFKEVKNATNLVGSGTLITGVKP